MCYLTLQLWGSLDFDIVGIIFLWPSLIILVTHDSSSYRLSLDPLVDVIKLIQVRSEKAASDKEQGIDIINLK